MPEGLTLAEEGRQSIWMPREPGRPPEPTGEVRLSDAVAFLARNRRWILAGALAGLAGGSLLVARMRPAYEGQASLRVEDAGSPLASIGIPALEGAARGGTLLTDVEMLRSRTLAAAVVDSFHLRVELIRPARVPRARVIAAFAGPPQAAGSYRLVPMGPGRFSVTDLERGVTLPAMTGGIVRLPGSVRIQLAPGASTHGTLALEILSRDEAVDRVRDALEVKRRRSDVDVIDVRFRSADPALARDVPNALTAVFMADRLLAQRSEAHGTASFLRGQIARISGQLDAAEEELRRFREASGLVSPELQAGAVVQSSAQLRAERDALAAESSALQALLRSGGGARDLVAFPSLLRNQAVAALLTSLATIEDRRTELLTRRNTSDPEVELLSARARELEAQLGALVRSYQRGLAGQAGALDAALSSSEGRLRTLPANEVRLARLQREVGVLEQVYTQMQARLKEAEIGEAAGDPSVRLLDAAVLPREPVVPRPVPYLSLALVLGMLAGVGAAGVREYRDRAVHSRRDIILATGLPVLALIPRTPRELGRGREAAGGMLPAARGSGHLLVREPRTPVSEAYDRLRVNLAFASPREPVRTVTITSPASGEGKTTSAANLALTQARRGRTVVLVDADLRCGRISEAFGLPRGPGLAELLAGEASLVEVLHAVEPDGATEMHVIPAGSAPADPAGLLASDDFRELLSRLRLRFDLVLLDAPPVNQVTDATLLALASDGVLLVARSGATSEDELREAVEHLSTVGAAVLGVVLNDVDFRREYGYDRAYAAYQRPYAGYG